MVGIWNGPDRRISSLVWGVCRGRVGVVGGVGSCNTVGQASEADCATVAVGDKGKQIHDLSKLRTHCLSGLIYPLTGSELGQEGVSQSGAGPSEYPKKQNSVSP